MLLRPLSYVGIVEYLVVDEVPFQFVLIENRLWSFEVRGQEVVAELAPEPLGKSDKLDVRVYLTDEAACEVAS